MQARERGRSAQPLGQRQFDLRVLSHRGKEADLRGVVSSCSVGGSTGSRPAAATMLLLTFAYEREL